MDNGCKSITVAIMKAGRLFNRDGWCLGSDAPHGRKVTARVRRSANSDCEYWMPESTAAMCAIAHCFGAVRVDCDVDQIVHGGAIVNKTTAEEVERLKNAEFEAERRHGEAMTNGDLTGARAAANDWIKASDALTEYVAAHSDPYRDGR